MNKGQVVVPCKHDEVNHRTYTLQNVEVDLPILGIADMPKDKGSVNYHEDGGVTVHGPTKAKHKFRRFGDVYFMKVLVPRRFIGDTSVFVRPGVVA